MAIKPATRSEAKGTSVVRVEILTEEVGVTEEVVKALEIVAGPVLAVGVTEEVVRVVEIVVGPVRAVGVMVLRSKQICSRRR